MFAKTSRRTLTAATAALTLAAGLAVGTASSASAEPAPATNTSSFSFTAPDQVSSIGEQIRLVFTLRGVGLTTAESAGVTASVNCLNGSWARIDLYHFENTHQSWAETRLQASDSGKTCTIQVAGLAPGSSVYFPANEIRHLYLNQPYISLYGDVVIHSRTGGL
ncbi:hypothetical protein B7R21_11070 [Subtercola boreus]|uniref:Uncharacterized protein n=1 Tax=Subtercola boreus TaxID=120213 RepID=A0A3E0VPE4_9MICO|nr:hypothetical protein [Subtercola boreus]RFA11884.1 hypothetical protein B7R21_11070 [Subtercola boreus]